MATSKRTEATRYMIASAAIRTAELLEAVANAVIREKAFYTLKEAAALVKYSDETLRRAIQRGELTASGMHGSPRIRGSALTDWMLRRGEKAAPKKKKQIAKV